MVCSDNANAKVPTKKITVSQLNVLAPKLSGMTSCPAEKRAAMNPKGKYAKVIYVSMPIFYVSFLIVSSGSCRQ